MKKQFGQFFTTNSDYILQGFEEFVKNKEVTDPFAGNQDLIKWVRKNDCMKAIGFDCDKKYVDNRNVRNNDLINFPRNINLFVLIRHIYIKTKRTKKPKKDFFLVHIQILKIYIRFPYFQF